MELKFDELSVDTPLAEDYLRKEQELSLLLNSNAKSPYYYDGRNYTQTKPVEPSIPPDMLNIQMERKLQDLADKLKNNITLLTQLQYLKHRVPIEDTVTQINVVVQQITYVANNMKEEMRQYDLRDLAERGPERFVLLDFDKPILALGLVPRVLIALEDVVLYADTRIVPVAQLFTKLCWEAGLPVTLVWNRNPSSVHHWVSLGRVSTIIVVSELSDVDSAVEESLRSTTSRTYWWSVRHIWVQKSVRQQFLDALKWKCSARARYCGEAELRCGDRAFCIDAESAGAASVSVRAYDTRRELLARLAECSRHRRHLLALWASDVAEVNELAHDARAPAVWVNDLPRFRGPPAVTEALYSHAQWTSEVEHDIQYEELSDRRTSWGRLDFETRRERLCSTLETFVERNPTKKTFWDSIKNNLEKTDLPNFVHVSEDYVCYGLSEHYESRYLLRIRPSVSGRFESILHADLEMVTKLLVSILNGNAVILPMSAECNESDEMFKRADIPIAYSYKYKECRNRFDSTPLTYILHPTTRVVWMNSGTICAN